MLAKLITFQNGSKTLTSKLTPSQQKDSLDDRKIVLPYAFRMKKIFFPSLLLFIVGLIAFYFLATVERHDKGYSGGAPLEVTKVNQPIEIAKEASKCTYDLELMYHKEDEDFWADPGTRLEIRNMSAVLMTAGSSTVIPIGSDGLMKTLALPSSGLLKITIKDYEQPPKIETSIGRINPGIGWRLHCQLLTGEHRMLYWIFLLTTLPGIGGAFISGFIFFQNKRKKVS